MNQYTFKDLCSIKTGKLDANAAVKDGQYPFFTCSKEPLKIDTYAYDCECILLAGNGEFNVNIYSGKFNAYQRTYIIQVNNPENTNLKYLFYLLKHSVNHLKNISTGGVIKFIKLGNIQSITIPESDFLSQRSIASELDKLQSVIDLKKQQVSYLDNLVKSRFIEMFGDTNNPLNWNVVSVEDVAEIQVGVVIKPAQFYTEKENGIKAFRSLNIGENCIKDDNWVYFSNEGNMKNSKSILKENDLLIVRSGRPGTACVVPKEYEGCNAIDVIIAHPNLDKVNPKYLCMYTNMPHGKNQIEDGTGGIAQQHFNIGKYKKIKLMLPPLDKQNEFVEFTKLIDKSKFVHQLF